MTTSSSNSAAGIPLTDDEKRVWDDIAWADHDNEVQRRYEGEWIALYHRRVIAHGVDRTQVIADAARALACPTEEIVIWPVGSADDVLLESDRGPSGF
jgi:hypothetical protein